MFVSIGHDNYVNSRLVVAVLRPGSAPMRKLKEQARIAGRLVDGTAGKPTRAFVLMSDGSLIQSVNTPATLVARLDAARQQHGGVVDEC